MRGELHESRFCLDGQDGISAPGYTDGTYWNGWARPLFTEPVIRDYLTRLGWEFSFDGDILTIHMEASGQDEVITPEYFNTSPDDSEYLYALEGFVFDDMADYAD